MTVVDSHSHILPGIDDGSRDLETSLEILKTCEEGSVEVIIATPHFYAWKDRVEVFLQRRQEALEQVLSRWNSEKLKIMYGAEVAYFEGMHKADRLEQLTIRDDQGRDTGLLLLEMPFQPWDEEVLWEVRALVEERGFHLILAHLERYLKLGNNRRMIEQLLELPVKVQINAGSLTDWRQRGTLVKWFKKGQAHLLGSDCHGMHRRPPNLWEGRAVLEKKLGSDFLKQLDAQAEELLQE